MWWGLLLGLGLGLGGLLLLELVLLAGGLLSAAYVFRIYRASFVENQDRDTFYHPSRALEVVPMVLALMSLGAGLVAEPVLSVMALPFEEGGANGQ